MLGNLPLHPMLVHFAVVFLVIAPILMVASALWPALRDRLDWITPLAALAAAVFCVLTAQTGEALEDIVQETPLVDAHADYGDLAEKMGPLLFAVAVLFWLATAPRFADFLGSKLPVLRSDGARIAFTVAIVVVSVVAVVIDVLAGHSGATAVWTR